MALSNYDEFKISNYAELAEAFIDANEGAFNNFCKERYFSLKAQRNK